MTEAPQAAKAEVRSEPAPRRWSFGSAVLDERTQELTVRGAVVNVERKPLEVLLFLLRHTGEVVSKGQVLDAVWPGRVLTEQVLTQCVSKLRNAIGDERQDIIRTVHGHGFRLVAPVQVEASPAQKTEPAIAPQAPSIPALPGPLIRTRWRTQWLVPAAIAGIVAAGILIWIGGRGLSTARAEKSVAILPFANLSADPDSQYFTDGLHDSVITHMAGVQDLRVISRTSVMHYRQGDRKLAEIAHELGVAHIVEASVQRADQRLHVNAQLINAATDAHVWAAEYDAELGDIFKVQAEIAEQITRAVRAELRPEEQARIEKPPTRNVAAYELYLRAQAIVNQAGPGAAQRYPESVAQLERAIALDPDFAAAYAQLSMVHRELYWSGLDPAPARLDRARAAADTALRLDPGLAQAHAARGMYFYQGPQNYAAAEHELAQAKRLAPGDAAIQSSLAELLRRKGQWEEALAGFAAAARLDPRNEAALSEHASTLYAMRRYAAAEQAYARMIPVAARPDLVKVDQAAVRFARTGELEPLENALAQIPSAPDPTCGVAFTRARLKMLRRDPAGAAAAILECPEQNAASTGAMRFPKEFFAAQFYRMAGDAKRAQVLYPQVRPQMEQSLRERPDQPRFQVPVAFVLANLGEREAAVALVDRALENMPVSRDAVGGAFLLTEAARFHASVGERARAIDELARALALPGWISAHEMALDPSWDPLRQDPRFRKMIAANLPKP
ncbi:MAG TPA: winged helix-turn-helix domain-containing protein [Solimonas sp.]|nr:winged helix-turn-helix domain-containing protein [Solimonas sp.]